MKKIQLSKQGPSLSQIVYGVWRLGDNPDQANVNDVFKKIDAALETGMTTFDHADIYGNYGCEELFGMALAERPSLREGMEIVTKAGIKLISDKRPSHKIKSYDTSPQHLMSSLERSLKNLHTDHVDLFLIHRPDPFMDVDATAGVLDKMVSSGKAKHVGVSNFTTSQFSLLNSRLENKLVTNQVELSCLHMDTLHDGTVDQAMELNCSPMAWSPLGGGRLFTGSDDQSIRVSKTLEKLANKYSADTAQMALAWLLSHPAKIIPIIGTNNCDRIKSMAKACDIKLSREEWFEIWEASAGTEVP